MRSKDRLAELRHLSRSAAGEEHCGAVEPEGATPHDKLIQDILQEVERMRGWVLDVDANTQLMCRLHADPTYHTNNSLQEQLEAAACAAHAAGLKACGALRQFEARAWGAGTPGAPGASTPGAPGAGSTAARVARLQHAGTRRALGGALARHRAALDTLRAHHLALLQHQILLTNVSVSEEECDALLESRDLALFVDNVRADTAAARRALRDVQARHAELARVEAALRDVRDLFAQLALLVAAQQDQVDSVEYYALQASEHVGSGGTQLLKGTVSHTKARKKKMSLIVCLVVGFAIVLLVLALT